MKDLTDRVAVVTGAGSGIGRAMAERFAAEGMHVVLADVQRDALGETEATLRARGTRVLAVPTDVSRASDVEALARRTLEAFGAAHVLCNNAGVVTAGLFWELGEADWEWVLGVNLWGVIHGCRIFVPIMLRQDTECHIVNTASMAGLVSSPMNPIYNVSKFGVVTLSESLHFDLRLCGAKIGVSVLCPGWVNTRIMDADRNRPPLLAARPPGREQTPQEAQLQQLARQLLAGGLAPERVAELVLAAVRDERFYILTHPELKGMIRARMEGILEERSPALTSFA